MRTQGKVIRLDGKYATVLCRRTSACDGCHKLADGGDCSVCSLMGHGKDVEARALNEVNACVGDTVALESATSRMLGYAALVFLLPVVALLGGYLLSAWWTSQAPYRYLCGVVAFILTFVGIRIYSERVIKRRSEVHVVEVIRTQADGQSTPES